MLLAMKAQQQSYSGLRSPGRSSSTYLCTDSECIPTARSVSTLHTVKTVLWPYRPYDCTDSAVVTDCLRRSNRKFSSNLSASSSGKAMHYWNIGDFFSLFQNLQVRCFVFSFSVCIFLALFLSCLYECFYQRNWINKCYFIFQCWKRGSFDSSVGRAEDCRVNKVILRSLVRIRLEGINFSPFSGAVDYTVPALRSSYWFWEILILFFHCNYSLVYD